MPTWKELNLEQNEKYQALSPEEKIAVKTEFFNKHIKPKAEAKKYDDNTIQQIKTEFLGVENQQTSKTDYVTNPSDPRVKIREFLRSNYPAITQPMKDPNAEFVRSGLISAGNAALLGAPEHLLNLAMGTQGDPFQRKSTIGTVGGSLAGLGNINQIAQAAPKVLGIGGKVGAGAVTGAVSGALIPGPKDMTERVMSTAGGAAIGSAFGLLGKAGEYFKYRNPAKAEEALQRGKEGFNKAKWKHYQNFADVEQKLGAGKTVDQTALRNDILEAAKRTAKEEADDVTDFVITKAAAKKIQSLSRDNETVKKFLEDPEFAKNMSVLDVQNLKNAFSKIRKTEGIPDALWKMREKIIEMLPEEEGKNLFQSYKTFKDDTALLTNKFNNTASLWRFAGSSDWNNPGFRKAAERLFGQGNPVIDDIIAMRKTQGVDKAMNLIKTTLAHTAVATGVGSAIAAGVMKKRGR